MQVKDAGYLTKLTFYVFGNFVTLSVNKVVSWRHLLALIVGRLLRSFHCVLVIHFAEDREKYVDMNGTEFTTERREAGMKERADLTGPRYLLKA